MPNQFYRGLFISFTWQMEICMLKLNYLLKEMKKTPKGLHGLWELANKNLQMSFYSLKKKITINVNIRMKFPKCNQSPCNCTVIWNLKLARRDMVGMNHIRYGVWMIWKYHQLLPPGPSIDAISWKTNVRPGKSSFRFAWRFIAHIMGCGVNSPILSSTTGNCPTGKDTVQIPREPGSQAACSGPCESNCCCLVGLLMNHSGQALVAL